MAWVEHKGGLQWLTEQRSYSMEPHQMASMKGIPWAVCKECGLVNLKNELTMWCKGKGCNYDLHPEYRSKVKSLGRCR